MSLTLLQLKMHCTHALPGGGSSTGLPPGSTATAVHQQIINEAGRALYNAWPWKFKERPPTWLSFSAPITIADATWTESTKTLTLTSGFTSYTHVPGDIITISAGTGATAGEYTIASRTSNNAIVLGESIGSAADGLTDIDGTIYFSYVNLPSDLGQVLDVRADGLTTDFCLTDFGTLAEMKDSSMAPAGYHYYGAVVYPAQSVQTTAFTQPRLELEPAPIAAADRALQLWYRAKWRELTDDTHYAAVPDFCESLLIQYIRAFTEGYDDSGVSSEMTVRVLNVNNLVAEIESGPLFRRATEADMLTQASYGVMRGGLIGAMGGYSPSIVRTQDVWQQADPFVY